MTVLNKHIFRVQFIAITVTLLALGLIDFVLAALNELNYRTNETYTASTAVQFVLLNTPSRLYTYSPYITLIGVLFATGQMANDRELVIYESSGLTKKMIVQKILTAPIVWLCIFFAFGETAAPYYEVKAKEIRDLAASKTTTQYGVWHKENDHFYFFSAIEQNGNIASGYRVSRDITNNTTNIDTFEVLTPSAQGLWHVNFVTENIISDEGVETRRNKNTQWELQATPELLLMMANKDLSLSVSTLWTYKKYLENQSLNNQQYELKFWQKLSQPLLSLTLVWLGIMFIFGPLRESTMGTRIFTGILVSLILNIAQSIMSPLVASFQVSAVLICALPIAIIVIITLGLSYNKKL